MKKINLEITVDDLVELVNWGDYFVEWEKGMGSTITQNERGLKKAEALHNKLSELLVENIEVK